MILKIKHFVTFITIILFISCNDRPERLSKISASTITIKDSLPEKDSITNLITPYKTRIDKVLDTPLAYAPKTISKNDGRYNTSAGNLLADILYERTNPIFSSRTGNNIDFVVLNHGGIRAMISKGHVTERTAYEVMPFENTVSVVELSGKSVLELVAFLIKSNRPHPISRLQIVLDKDGNLNSLNVNGVPFDDTKNYKVATSNYLVSGGDNMVFFGDGIHITNIDYTIRNAIIDHFKKVDTITAKIDERFIRLTQ